ncbi:hypothetical protein BC937DRAFT_95026 [Endogone sp. FLAS-F59071]|nr:hypothetical protein BC937DRAFT_95026 [Endogone sp. FLAS-F59071]|eukprot:RUS20518.1 hypothetical protein BC937DRAFT_95026 [Endogone sp. FLAS-F59071]
MSATEILDAPPFEALKPDWTSDDGPCITTEQGLVHLHAESDMAYLGFAEAEEPFAGGLLSEVTLPENTAAAQNEIEIVPIFDSNQDDSPTADDAHNTHVPLTQ